MKTRFSLGLILGCIVMFVVSPVWGWQQSTGDCVQGNGKRTQQQRSLRDYKRMEVQGAYTLHISSGKDFSCTISGDSNLLEHVKTVVEKGKLRIGSDRSLCMQQPIEITLTQPQLDSFYAEGAHDITIANISGKEFDFELFGSCVAKLSGTTDKLEMEISGSSSVDASGLKAVEADVAATGTSSAHVNVSGKLDVEASGVSEVVYSGNPAKVKTELSGLADVAAR